MENLKKRLEVFAQKLEDDPDYEMSDEMQDEYLELQKHIVGCGDYDLEERFNQIANEYENPDSVVDGILKDMFPDTDGGFDLDDMWKD